MSLTVCERQNTVFDFVTNGADSTFELKELETRDEIQLMAYMKLWSQLGWLRAYFAWQLLSSDDMERMTKMDGVRPNLVPVPIEESGVGYDEDGSIAGTNGLEVRGDLNEGVMSPPQPQQSQEPAADAELLSPV